jgi:hypothetical protein
LLRNHAIWGSNRNENEGYRFWGLTLHILINKYQHSRRTGCLHHQGNNK